MKKEKKLIERLSYEGDVSGGENCYSLLHKYPL